MGEKDIRITLSLIDDPKNNSFLCSLSFYLSSRRKNTFWIDRKYVILNHKFCVHYHGNPLSFTRGDATVSRRVDGKKIQGIVRERRERKRLEKKVVRKYSDFLSAA